VTEPRFTPLDAHDAARIICRRRPHWDEKGVIAALGRTAYDLDITQALHAGLSAAADPEARTPDAILWERHKAKPVQTPAQRPGQQAPRCREHTWLNANNCPACWSEVKSDPPTRTRDQIGLKIHD
jgi:hypothetical protein